MQLRLKRRNHFETVLGVDHRTKVNPTDFAPGGKYRGQSPRESQQRIIMTLTRYLQVVSDLREFEDALCWNGLVDPKRPSRHRWPLRS